MVKVPVKRTLLGAPILVSLMLKSHIMLPSMILLSTACSVAGCSRNVHESYEDCGQMQCSWNQTNHEGIILPPLPA